MAEMDMKRFKQALQQTEADAEARQSSFVREISIEGVAYPDWRPEETTREHPDINLIRLAPPLRDGELCYVQFLEQSVFYSKARQGNNYKLASLFQIL